MSIPERKEVVKSNGLYVSSVSVNMLYVYALVQFSVKSAIKITILCCIIPVKPMLRGAVLLFVGTQKGHLIVPKHCWLTFLLNLSLKKSFVGNVKWQLFLKLPRGFHILTSVKFIPKIVRR